MATDAQRDWDNRTIRVPVEEDGAWLIVRHTPAAWQRLGQGDQVPLATLTHYRAAWIHPQGSGQTSAVQTGEGPAPMLQRAVMYSTAHGYGDYDGVVVHTQWSCPYPADRPPYSWLGPWVLWLDVLTYGDLARQADDTGGQADPPPTGVSVTWRKTDGRWAQVRLVDMGGT